MVFSVFQFVFRSLGYSVAIIQERMFPMKQILAILLCILLLTGCAAQSAEQPTEGTEGTVSPEETRDALPEDYVYQPLVSPSANETPFVSRFGSETEILLSDDGIQVDGGEETETVFTSHDIVYYEEKTEYESGNPYGNGDREDMHSAQEAQAHTVVNITAPGAYRVRGTLSAGQIRIDLGEDAQSDPDAVVELILEDASITCTVAPAILFRNVYECDGDWSTETAGPDVDTRDAGAILVLEGENTVSGSYVAKIYKDKEGEKKLWKQDGAIYSYMSMNVYGPGALDLTAENEGLDTELHLSIYGGDITIRSQDDGINTNEDGVSVTTIWGGTIHIIAGLGAEGDGIDSNGYLVIHGGTVVSVANPASDAGLDSDLGSYIHGGTVIALGSTMDWAESDSEQVTMNLQFARNQSGALVVTRTDGTVIFAYSPDTDEVIGSAARVYSGAVISCANFVQGESYYVYQGGTLTGMDEGGILDPATITAYEGGSRLAYTGTDVMTRPGGFGGGGHGGPGGRGDHDAFGGKNPPEGEIPTMPDGEMPTMPEGEMPSMPEGEMPSMPEGEIPSMPDGEAPPDRNGMAGDSGEANTLFYMQDKVNFFSGLTPAE